MRISKIVCLELTGDAIRDERAFRRYMEPVMRLEIPDDILQGFGLTEQDCLSELSVHLYASRHLCLGQALRLSGLNRFDFERQLAQRDISLYTVDDLHEDVETLRELGRL
jgi:predicted HTH domain antitoxin